MRVSSSAPVGQVSELLPLNLGPRLSTLMLDAALVALDAGWRRRTIERRIGAKLLMKPSGGRW